jgi:hypothetical protein
VCQSSHPPALRCAPKHCHRDLPSENRRVWILDSRQLPPVPWRGAMAYSIYRNIYFVYLLSSDQPHRSILWHCRMDSPRAPIGELGWWQIGYVAHSPGHGGRDTLTHGMEETDADDGQMECTIARPSSMTGTGTGPRRSILILI